MRTRGERVKKSKNFVDILPAPPAPELLVGAGEGAHAAVLAGAAGRRGLAARPGEVLRADAPQLGRRRAALQTLLHRVLRQEGRHPIKLLGKNIR